MLRRVRSLLPLFIAAALGLSACSAPEPGTNDSQNTATEAVAPVVARPPKQYAIEDFIDTVSVHGASFSPDDSRVMFSSNRSGIWNAYTMPVGGGEWTAVTQSTTDNVYAVGYFPNDARMLVTRDAGSNELNHLYVIEADGSERDLTPGDKLKAAFAGFNRAGDAFYVSSNERDQVHNDIIDRTCSTADQFHFLARGSLVMHSPQGPLATVYGNARLNPLGGKSMHLELFLAPDPRKHSPLIRHRFRVKNKGTLEGSFGNNHGYTCTSRIGTTNFPPHSRM